LRKGYPSHHHRLRSSERRHGQPATGHEVVPDLPGITETNGPKLG
jgi:hypothetical protein